MEDWRQASTEVVPASRIFRAVSFGLLIKPKSYRLLCQLYKEDFKPSVDLASSFLTESK